MNQRIFQISLLVDDYDDAISFYTKKLGFELISDETLSPTKRWVIVRPHGKGDCGILLAKADGETQKQLVGNQSGGRVMLFLSTDDIDRDLLNMKSNEIKIVRGPSEAEYGRVVVFEDLYGNKWDLIQPKK